MGVAVDAEPRIERQPCAERLSEVDVTGHLVLRLVDLRLFVSVEKPVPRFAAEVEVVEAHRQPVAREELRTLVPRHPQHPVARVEPVVERFAARGIAVVDLVPPPVVEEAQGARRAVVAVGQGGGGPSARDARVVVDERRRHLARI